MNTAIIPLNGADLVTAKDENGNIYVAMKPVVEGIGLDWKSQSEKIKSDERYGDITIPYETAGGIQNMTSLPLDQLAGWLYSINPNKVREDIKETIIKFQQETFSVINKYWSGEDVDRHPVANNIPQSPMEVLTLFFEVQKEQDQRITEVKDEVKQLASSSTLDYSQQQKIQKQVGIKASEFRMNHNLGKDMNKKLFSGIYRALKNRFEVGSYKDVPKVKFAEAIDFINRVTFNQVVVS